MKPFLILFFLNIVFHICYSQGNCKYKTSVPDELYRGRYKPANANYGNPYTMFNKRKPNWNLEDELKEIRTLITTQVENGQAYGYAVLYKAMYDTADGPEPAACNYNQEICGYPAWVKNNAILYLIGIKYSRIDNIDVFEYIANSHDPERLVFAERAANGLRNLNPNIQTCFGGGDCGILKNKALDLINYLQAYDALKTAKYYREGDGDRNGGDCSGRNKLREYTRNFYIESEDVINSFTGWKRNHGIMCASALGMAAIVLNDAGVETDWFSFGVSVLNPLMWIANGVHIPRPNYSPKNWQKRDL